MSNNVYQGFVCSSDIMHMFFQYAGVWYTYAMDPFYYVKGRPYLEDSVRDITVHNDTYLTTSIYVTIPYVFIIYLCAETWIFPG